MLIGLVVVVVISAIFTVYAKHLNRVYFAELQAEQKIRDEKNIEWGQLLLEESTFAASSEIEKRARRELKMRQPEPNDIVMIQQ